MISWISLGKRVFESKRDFIIKFFFRNGSPSENREYRKLPFRATPHRKM